MVSCLQQLHSVSCTFGHCCPFSGFPENQLLTELKDFGTSVLVSEFALWIQTWVAWSCVFHESEKKICLTEINYFMAHETSVFQQHKCHQFFTKNGIVNTWLVVVCLSSNWVESRHMFSPKPFFCCSKFGHNVQKNCNICVAMHQNIPNKICSSDSCHVLKRTWLSKLKLRAT